MIPMRVRAYLAAIEAHNWELEGVEHTYSAHALYQIIKIYNTHGRH